MTTEETTANTSTTPRIYVASLSDYNAGTLHGRWIDATQPADEIHAEISAMLAESKEPVAEEWAIHDYENFSGASLSEFEDIERVSELARLIEEHGSVFAGLVDHFGGTHGLEEAKQYMEEGYQGSFRSLSDYAEGIIQDCYADALRTLPEFIRYHIDFEGIARDMELGGDVFTIECDGLVHVFQANL